MPHSPQRRIFASVVAEQQRGLLSSTKKQLSNQYQKGGISTTTSYLNIKAQQTFQRKLQDSTLKLKLSTQKSLNGGIHGQGLQ